MTKSKKETKAIAETSLEETVEAGMLTAQEIEEQEMQENYDRMMANIQKNQFGHTKKGLLAVKAAMQSLSLKTGMYARIPIYCKGDGCPYAESCQLLSYGMAPEGEACPTEVAMLGQKLQKYTDEFGLDKKDASVTDQALVEEIILMEISMERCKALMAQETNPIQHMVVGMSENGEAIYQPQVSKTVEAYERFSKKRNADYDLLMATRKNKKSSGDEQQQSTMDIIMQAEEMDGFYDIEKRPADMQDAEYTEAK